MFDDYIKLCNNFKYETIFKAVITNYNLFT